MSLLSDIEYHQYAAKSFREDAAMLRNKWPDNYRAQSLAATKQHQSETHQMIVVDLIKELANKELD